VFLLLTETYGLNPADHPAGQREAADARKKIEVSHASAFRSAEVITQRNPDTACH
jgi:hypothetical protein